jgi:hypothetical protein
MVKKLKNTRNLFKKEVLKERAFIIQQKMIQTDKIIKIIWENIYLINQYKEKVLAEKLGSEKIREEIL